MFCVNPFSLTFINFINQLHHTTKDRNVNRNAWVIQPTINFVKNKSVRYQLLWRLKVALYTTEDKWNHKKCCKIFILIVYPLTLIDFNLTNSVFVFYCYSTWLLHTICIKSCTTKCFTVQVLRIRLQGYTEPIKSIMFSMILNAMLLIILQFTRLSYIALCT